MRLEEIRARINEIDVEIIDLLSERMRLAYETAEVKRRMGAPIVDEERKREVIKNWCEVAKQKNLDVEMIVKLIKTIIEHTTQAEELHSDLDDSTS